MASTLVVVYVCGICQCDGRLWWPIAESAAVVTKPVSLSRLFDAIDK